MSLTAAALTASSALQWESLGLHPVALDLGLIQLRWYSLAYLAGILLGWWYLLKLIARPGAPLERRHVDDLVFLATLGVILGGRLGYVIFYRPDYYISNPLEIVQVWDGGMSFHGGVIGVALSIVYLSWKNKLNWLRVHDYVACTVPIGLFFGRLANFVNGELWGRPSNLPWAMTFPGGGDVPRHPSQLYEAALEGLILFVLLSYLFWRTNARLKPGMLVGTFLLGYGISRFLVEMARQPDRGLEHLSWGLSMGQTLTVPMIVGGGYLLATAGARVRTHAASGTQCPCVRSDTAQEGANP